METPSRPNIHHHGHPYYPPAVPITNYVPNDTHLFRLLPFFGGVVGAFVALAYRQAARSRLPLRSIDRFAVAWYALCGFLHVAFEGYFIYHGSNLAGMNTTFAQLWKEYALSDSRYLTSDVFVASIETITVFAWGPLSWLALFAVLSNAPWRHIAQAVLSTAHLYGVALYYMTNWVESRFHGISCTRPEFLYFWVYFIGFNFPWVVVPLVLLGDSLKQTSRAFLALNEKEHRVKTN